MLPAWCEHWEHSCSKHCIMDHKSLLLCLEILTTEHWLSLLPGWSPTNNSDQSSAPLFTITLWDRIRIEVSRKLRLKYAPSTITLIRRNDPGWLTKFKWTINCNLSHLSIYGHIKLTSANCITKVRETSVEFPILWFCHCDPCRFCLTNIVLAWALPWPHSSGTSFCYQCNRQWRQ